MNPSPEDVEDALELAESIAEQLRPSEFGGGDSAIVILAAALRGSMKEYEGMVRAADFLADESRLSDARAESAEKELSSLRAVVEAAKDYQAMVDAHLDREYDKPWDNVPSLVLRNLLAALSRSTGVGK